MSAHLMPYLVAFVVLLLVGAALWFFFVPRWRARDEQQQADLEAPARHETVLDLGGRGRLRVVVEPVEQGDTDPDHQLAGVRPADFNLAINADGEIETTVQPAPGPFTWRGIQQRLARWPYGQAQTLFAVALLLYTVTRLVGLSDYPIYFFSDEAVQANLAADFLRDDFRNYDGELLPTYFVNVDKYSLGITVYAQVIPYLLFGKSVFVTRAASALLTVLGAYWVGLILRDAFKLKHWWLGTLLLGLTPAWFLHSRTAFETAMMASFYAGFLYHYLRYRDEQPYQLYLALAWGALAFYTYNPGRVVVVLTGFFFLLSDLKYHWTQRKKLWPVVLFLVLLAWPFIRFQRAHPTTQIDQLRLLASYWVQPQPLSAKLAIFFENYGRALSPSYWFIYQDHDMARHQMGVSPHLPSPYLVFFGLGILLAMIRVRQPAYRALLLALLAAPSGAALVSIGITRVLVFVIPAVLLVGLGLERVLDWLHQRQIPRQALALVLFTFMAAAQVFLLSNALTNGPTWHADYGLSGMQYGARQLFAAIEDYLAEYPDRRLYVSPNWTNGANVVAYFFLGDEDRVELGAIDGYLNLLKPDIDERVFVLAEDEYATALTSGKLTGFEVDKVINYPDGRPGFYFVRMRYVDDIAEILSAEIAARRELVDTSVVWRDEPLRLLHSLLDLGAIEQLFDDDWYTVARTAEANPFVIEMHFDQPHTFSGYDIVVGSAHVLVSWLAVPVDGEMVSLQTNYHGSVDHPVLQVEFDQPITTEWVRLEVLDQARGEPANIHVWELTLLEE